MYFYIILVKLEIEKESHENWIKTRSNLINQFIEEESKLNTTLDSPRHVRTSEPPPLSPSAHDAYYRSLTNSLL